MTIGDALGSRLRDVTVTETPVRTRLRLKRGAESVPRALAIIDNYIEPHANRSVVASTVAFRCAGFQAWLLGIFLAGARGAWMRANLKVRRPLDVPLPQPNCPR